MEAIRKTDDLVRLGKRVKDQGFLGLKTNMITFNNEVGASLYMPGTAGRPGWPDLNVPSSLIGQLRDQLIAMQDGAGPDVGIRLDLNFNFKPEGYRQVTTALDDLDLTWIEIDLYDPMALVRLENV